MGRMAAMGATKRRMALAAAVAWLGLGIGWPAASLAQPAGTGPAPVAPERLGPVSPEKRAELQRLLDEHAAVLQSQAIVLKTVAKLIGPSVVHLEADTVRRSSADYNRGRRGEEAGSGVIIQWQGKFYALTNRHVIQGAAADAIRINLADGRQIHPLRVLDDVETDVAVLPLDARKLVAAPLGNSDRLETGDFVLAVGSPFGLSHSVTFGIISAKGRRDLHLDDAGLRFQDFLQTDAAIHPGNSGGPLCNLRGEVIGINTAIATNSGRNEGIGFAIPVNMFMAVARQLIETGQVVRAFLGVTLDARFGAALAAEIGLPGLMGARVTALTPGSPAETARLQPGDVILEIDGTKVEDDLHLINLVGLLGVGKTVPLVIFRDGKTISTTVQLSDRSKFGP
jgi:serine protease Do